MSSPWVHLGQISRDIEKTFAPFGRGKYHRVFRVCTVAKAQVAIVVPSRVHCAEHPTDLSSTFVNHQNRYGTPFHMTLKRSIPVYEQ